MDDGRTDRQLPRGRDILAPLAPPILGQWYVAAFRDEVTTAPLGRTICNKPVVLYRRENGTVAALEDRCSHRRYPLSRGKVAGDLLRCGYHGAAFDADGRCVAIPGQEAIPASLNLRAYPVAERDGVIFLWPGDAADADPESLPDWHVNEAAEWATVRGIHHMPANYQLVLDNLLDLTHVQFVHRNLGGPGVAESPLQFSVDGDVVNTFRMMRNVELPGIFKALGKTGRFDRWQRQIVRAPAYVYFEAGAEAAGSDDPPREPHHVVVQGITPETDSTTHYFWATARHFAIDDDDVSAAMRAITVDAFDEDVAVLAAQQRSIDQDDADRPLNAFACDAAGLAVRRILARMIGAQTKSRPTSPPRPDRSSAIG
ncbi:MAG: aromatic ring-hydroxylating dioxygenase subunit alpha [Alphaproteobacteria bacterium]|nr:aromatic ring-hydroxylating dioxygenase subunit alpha [Alphaproteobacteria bacterium]